MEKRSIGADILTTELDSQNTAETKKPATEQGIFG
jgi:hypothetical protein